MTFAQYGKPKQCQNNCGQEIVWDKQGGYFINTSNSVKHDCPKWEKKSFTPGAAQTATTTTTARPEKIDLIIELLTGIDKRLTTLEQGQSMDNWLVEKVARKVGVDDVLDDTSK
jgi:hypothetical protein